MPHLLRTGSVFRLSHSTGLCFHTQNFNYRSFLACFEVDFTCLEVRPLEMDSSVFGLFTELCVHSHCLIPEHVHQWSVPRLLCPQLLATTSLLSALVGLPLPDVRGKWSHTRVVSVSGPFGQRGVSQPVAQHLLLWDVAGLGRVVLSGGLFALVLDSVCAVAFPWELPVSLPSSGRMLVGVLIKVEN